MNKLTLHLPDFFKTKISLLTYGCEDFLAVRFILLPVIGTARLFTGYVLLILYRVHLGSSILTLDQFCLDHHFDQISI